MLSKLKTKIYKALRWSEKFTKTDMVYLAKGGSWLLIGQSFTSISILILSIAYANFLPKESYGIYKYILSIAGILGSLSLTGMNTAIVQSVARGFEGILKSAFLIQLKWSILIIIGSLVGFIYYFINNNYIISVSFLIIGSFLPLIQSGLIYDAFLNGKKEFKIKTIYGILKTAIPTLALLLTIIITNNPLIIVFVYFLTTAVIVLFLYLKTIKKFQPANKTDFDSIKYGKHLSLMNILSTATAQIDKILIFHYLGPAQLAIYAFAISVPEEIKNAVKNIGTLALPKFTKIPKEELKKSILNKMLLFASLMTIIIIIYILTAPFVYKILFPQYSASIIYSQIFSISLITIISILPMKAMQAKMATEQLYIFNIYKSIIQIIITFYLIYSFGLIGAIATRVIMRFIGLIFSYLMFKKI